MDYFFDKTATIYQVSYTLVNWTQKLAETNLWTFDCDYRVKNKVNNNDDTTALSDNPKYKELVLKEETGLKRGDRVEISDQGGFNEGKYEVLDRARHDDIEPWLDNIVYQIKQIDG